MPDEPGISISKKIENSKERARLKSVVSLIKPVGVGVIIRTEAEGGLRLIFKRIWKYYLKNGIILLLRQKL